MSNISSGGQLTKWSNELATGTTVNLTKLTSDAIADFLRSAGQIQLLEQVEQVETGFRISLDKMKASLNLGLQLLGHCSTMASMYPQGTVVCIKVHKIVSLWCKTALGEVGVSLP